MKILNWMQNKLNGKQGSKKPIAGSSIHHTMKEARRDEFSDWPHGLLAIGTFGNNDINEGAEEKHDAADNSQSLQDSLDFTVEDIGKLQKELMKLLRHKPAPNVVEAGTGEGKNLPLNKFLNCPSSLEIDRTNRERSCDDLHDREDDISSKISVILGRGKEVNMDNNNAIRQRSISFLLKKMFVCRSGFALAPSLRDPIPESRMEKFLKAILHKKIYPQSTSPTTGTKKYLQNKAAHKKSVESGKQERANDGSKWVKTDSEYIVLEI